MTSSRRRHPENCADIVPLADLARSAPWSLKPLHKIDHFDLLFVSQTSEHVSTAADGIMASMELGNIHGQDPNQSTSALLLGGFFLTQSVVEPKLDLIPAGGFLTVSKCLGDFVPDDWVYWNPRERKTAREDRAKALGIDVGHLDYLTEWCLREYNEKRTLGYPNIIFDIETGRELAGQVLGLSQSRALSLLGIGLPFELSGKFFQSMKRALNSAKELPFGVPTILERGLILPPEGDILGFDALGYEPHGTFHSSKCYGSRDPRLSKISFNDYGYCTTLLDAKTLCEIHAKNTAEEIVWLPWEIRRYSLEIRKEVLPDRARVDTII